MVAMQLNYLLYFFWSKKYDNNLNTGYYWCDHHRDNQ